MGRKKERIPDYVFPPTTETPENLDNFSEYVKLIQSEYFRVCIDHHRFCLKEFRGWRNVRYCAFCGRIYIESNINYNIDVDDYVEYRKRILSGDFDNI